MISATVAIFLVTGQGLLEGPGNPRFFDLTVWMACLLFAAMP